ncbi:MAG: folylpolyglutamate synthase/dihydrofolate synthase family protein [Planctomycetota bacterium]
MTIEDRTRKDMPSATDVANRELRQSYVPAVSVDQAQERLLGAINYERRVQTPYNRSFYRLDRMRRLAEILGNPHLKYPVIHVAGSKGKGTVAHVLAAALEHAGYQTGLYTSPHLVRLHERFRFCGQPASDEQLLELTNRVLEAAEQLRAEDEFADGATFFEITTAMAMLHFAEQKADCAVLEVGMGGRLDSTNICEPELCIITSIGLDHEKQLGSTIAEIASEKAGIIKAGVLTVCSARDPSAREAIQQAADDAESELHLLDRDFQCAWQPHQTNPTAEMPVDGASAELSYSVTAASFGEEAATTTPLTQFLKTRLLGRHQADNLSAAIRALQGLNSRGMRIPWKSIEHAVAQAQPPARMQVIDNNPTSILDTAHNPASIEAGLDALESHYPGKPVVAVFAPSRDKDYAKMLDLLLARTQQLVITHFHGNPRAVPLDDLHSLASKKLDHLVDSDGMGSVVHKSELPKHAWGLARQLAANEGAIVYAAGSFFLAAELLAGQE